MGVISGITYMFTDLGDFMRLFSSFFDCLPMVVKILTYFAFGGILLLGLLQMFLRSV